MVWVWRRISKKFEVARSRVVRLSAVSRPQLIASTLIQPLLDLTQNRRLQSFIFWSVWKTTQTLHPDFCNVDDSNDDEEVRSRLGWGGTDWHLKGRLGTSSWLHSIVQTTQSQNITYKTQNICANTTRKIKQTMTSDAEAKNNKAGFLLQWRMEMIYWYALYAL